MRLSLLLGLVAVFSLPLHSEPLSLDSSLVGKGKALYEKLKRDHPDAPMPSDADLAPHTVDISMISPAGGYSYLDFSLPVTVWEKLTQKDEVALVAFIRWKVKDAKQNPANYASIVPQAPAYPAQIQSIQTMDSEAWQINVGHLDGEGYLIEDKAVMQGSGYATGLSGAPILTYANAKDDPVFNSGWDGSVSQVVDYHKKHLADPGSVEYSDWTKVIKTGVGYQVSVTFRAKNEFGGYVIHDQTFTFDSKGAVNKVTNNDQ